MTENNVNKLIIFENDNLNLIKDNFIFDNPNNKLVIVSFLGKARIGKSTFMNCFTSYLTKTNKQLFTTSSSIKEHCTTGIDILQIETETINILLLDVQGLDFKDSKNDCKIMLFVFMLSDIIVYNEKGILTNSVLSSFQSLTSLVTYVHEKTSPKLIFRSIDIDEDLEDYESTENLDGLLQDTDDQYQNVRKSIKKLFSSIICYPTYLLDKTDKQMLKKNDFINFLKYRQDNGFLQLCINLELEIKNCNTNNNINDLGNKLNSIIEHINENQNINFKVFDLTSSQAYIAIRKWEDKFIDNSKFNEISVDGTQKNYDECIKPIMDYRDIVLQEFERLFNLTTPNIKNETYERLYNKFNSVIDTAYNKTLEIATNKLEIIYNTIINKETTVILNSFLDKNYLCDRVLNWNNYYNFTLLSETSYLDITKNHFINKLNNEIDIFNNSLYERYKNINKNAHDKGLKLFNRINLLLTQYKNDLLTKQYQIKQSFDSIVNELIKKIFHIVQEFDTIFEYLRFTLKSGLCIKFPSYREIIQNSSVMLYYLTKYDNFIIIDEITTNDIDVMDVDDIYKQLNITFLDLCKFSISNDNKYVDSKETRKFNNSIKEYITEVYSNFISDYLTKTCYEQYKSNKAKYLDNELLELNKKYELNCDNNISEIQYAKLKKYHSDNYVLCESILNGDNDVCYLDIFNYIDDYIKISKVNYSLNQCLIRYIYLLNNHNITEILSKDKFNEKFNIVLRYYKRLKPNNTLFNYELVVELVNILFVYYLK